MSWEEVLNTFSYEEELERAKWYHEDLKNNNGWSEASRNDFGIYWVKLFPDETVPLKVLCSVDLPLPATAFIQLLDPCNFETRLKWDAAFSSIEILEELPDKKGYVSYLQQANASWPLTTRDFVLLQPTSTEVDWYGKSSTLSLYKNAKHLKKPDSNPDTVRSTNGGNFFIITPDVEEPERKCKVFGLSNNNYNGHLNFLQGNWFFRQFISKQVVKTFHSLFEGIVEGYEKFIK